MTNKRDLPPLAVCTNCCVVSYDAQVTNNPCGRILGGKRCRGSMGGALQKTDWEECPSCLGSGCSQCTGVGWIFVRDMPWRRKPKQEKDK